MKIQPLFGENTKDYLSQIAASSSKATETPEDSFDNDVEPDDGNDHGVKSGSRKAKGKIVRFSGKRKLSVERRIPTRGCAVECTGEPSHQMADNSEVTVSTGECCFP